MDIIAVVVTFNRKMLLHECLTALMKQTYSCKKIVLIDNNSTDGTYDMLEKEGFLASEVISYKKMEKNIGGAGGFSRGIRYALEWNPDFVWIMDDDTIPENTALEELVNAQKDKTDKISFLASVVFGEKNEPMNVPQIASNLSSNGYPNWYCYLDEGLIEITIATFVSLLININAIKAVGLPCEDYFIWGDDTEYTLRLTQFYGKAFFCGKSKVLHKRKDGGNLSLIEEENENRFKLYYYSYRNNLINTFEYEGIKKGVLLILHNVKDIMKVLFKGKHKAKKMSIILKSNIDFIWGKYDRKRFKTRFEI